MCRIENPIRNSSGIIIGYDSDKDLLIELQDAEEAQTKLGATDRALHVDQTRIVQHVKATVLSVKEISAAVMQTATMTGVAQQSIVDAHHYAPHTTRANLCLSSFLSLS
jgi:hypothetical protein